MRHSPPSKLLTAIFLSDELVISFLATEGIPNGAKVYSEILDFSRVKASYITLKDKGAGISQPLYL